MIRNQTSCVIDMSIKPIGLSALHDIHQGLQAVFAEKDGWKKPIRYGSAKEEANHLKVGIGVTDVSFDFKLMIQGNGIASFLAKKLPENKILDTNRSAIDGSLSKDWTIYSRLAFDELFVVSDYSRSEQFHKSIPEEIRQGLLLQVENSVRWEQCVRGVLGMNCSPALELGPGKVLRGHVRKIDREAVVESIGTLESLDNPDALPV